MSGVPRDIFVPDVGISQVSDLSDRQSDDVPHEAQVFKGLPPLGDLGFRIPRSYGAGKMIWYFLIGYVLLTQTIMVCTVLAGLRDPRCVEVVGFDSLPKWERQKAIALSILAAIVIAPIYLPYAVITCLFAKPPKELQAEADKWRKIARTYRPLEHDPRHRYNIDDELWAYFEEQTTSLVPFDYQVLGNFTVRTEPVTVISRHLLHPEGKVLVCIADIRGAQHVEVMTFLKDGSVIDSANCGQISGVDELAKGGFHVQCIEGADMLEVLESHEQFVKEIELLQDSTILEVPESNWKAFHHYSDQLFGDIRFEAGLLDNGPDAVQFPGEPKDASSEIPMQAETKLTITHWT